MNTRDILNMELYPKAFDNVRRKDTPYFDQITFAAGTQEYFFFRTAPGAIFARNKQLPLSGSEVFFCEIIKGLFRYPKLAVADVNVLDEFLQQCYLEITVDQRQMMKIPVLDFLLYQLTLNEDATPEVLKTWMCGRPRKLNLPIVFNSTSAFEIKLWVTAAVATAFDGLYFELVLEGLQLDKLTSFTWDQVKNNMFQQLSVTYYETQHITTGNQTIYQFFTTPTAANNLFSAQLPLSNDRSMSVEAIEVFIGQPDTAIVPYTIYNNSLLKLLEMRRDETRYFNGNLADILSVVASYGGNITDSNADTTAYVNMFNHRQIRTLRVPFEIPANAETAITITQPAASLPITGEITLCLYGTETRRLA